MRFEVERASAEVDCVIGMGASNGMMVPAVHGPAMYTYASPNAHAMRFPVRLNLRAVNAFRAPGFVEGTTAYEQAIDDQFWPD